jgi:hypothetical protein
MILPHWLRASGGGLALVLVAMGVGACNGDDPPDGVTTCVDYAAVDTMVCGGPCTLANDVMPIFQNSCTLSSSCHDSAAANPAGEGLKLGPKIANTPTQADLDAVHDFIVNGTSVRSDNVLVAPGNPAGSWLLAKVEYNDFEVCGPVHAACDNTAKGCGIRMPFSSEALGADRLAILRAWIVDGAQNN